MQGTQKKEDGNQVQYMQQIEKQNETKIERQSVPIRAQDKKIKPQHENPKPTFKRKLKAATKKAITTTQIEPHTDNTTKTRSTFLRVHLLGPCSFLFLLFFLICRLDDSVSAASLLAVWTANESLPIFAAYATFPMPHG